jgi:hypothetical protein
MKYIEYSLKPSGTCFVVIGDTYAGSGGAGGDYNKGGLREGQLRYRQAVSQICPLFFYHI